MVRAGFLMVRSAGDLSLLRIRAGPGLQGLGILGK